MTQLQVLECELFRWQSVIMSKVEHTWSIPPEFEFCLNKRGLPDHINQKQWEKNKWKKKGICRYAFVLIVFYSSWENVCCISGIYVWYMKKWFGKHWFIQYYITHLINQWLVRGNNLPNVEYLAALIHKQNGLSNGNEYLALSILPNCWKHQQKRTATASRNWSQICSV